MIAVDEERLKIPHNLLDLSKHFFMLYYVQCSMEYHTMTTSNGEL